MGIAKSKPVRFVPTGLSDAADSTHAFQGACTSLQNLIFDQANPQCVISRPGVTLLTNFTGFTTPGYVSCHIGVGTLIYGMVASGRNAGKDEPFCWDTVNNVFITISGVTNATTPLSPASTGAWTPPTMAVVGVYIVITHPGFTGVVAN